MKQYIDEAFAQHDSILLRYHQIFAREDLALDDLRATSIKEGARICRLTTYRGVSIYVVDETTLMTGGSYKALEASVSMAGYRKRRYERVAFSAGANNGICLTIYGQKAGVETFFFHPAATGWKLDAATFTSPTAHLISVDKPEKEVKRAARLFAERRGIPHVPDERLRYWASGPRAFLVYEHAREHRLKFDWIGQAVCAGFGPIAFYNHTRRLLADGAIERSAVPKFLGVQQEGLAPMVSAWCNRHEQIEQGDVALDGADLLVPNLYNTNPAASYPELVGCLREFGGDLRLVNRAEFDALAPQLVRDLATISIVLTRLGGAPEGAIAEKAGLLGLVGTLRAIDQGTVAPGETILCFMTGGAAKLSGERAVPDFSIARDEVLEDALTRYLAQLDAGNGKSGR